MPAAHEGGELVIEHNRRPIVFDWSSQAPDRIHWAAFYSDCGHKIMPLKSGHRVTLTYNLFYRSTQPEVSHGLSMPLNSFPIYHDLQAALKAPGFMKRGGILGFGCNHAYAHSDEKMRRELPMAMKGVDLLIYTVCRALGLKTKARPVLERTDLEDWWNDDDSDGYSDETDCIDEAARRRLMDFQRDGRHLPENPKKYRGHLGIPETTKTSDDSKSETKLSLKYQTESEPMRRHIESYMPKEVNSKREYLKRHLNVAGLVPRSRVELVGSRFHKVRYVQYIDDEDSNVS